ncbi:MAG: hypothetical protein C4539_12475 [Ignavibacteriales bacterium]|nr:MAG: hypothetical protein C4539_12475 [Ignavibacteriales bacterium]
MNLDKIESELKKRLKYEYKWGIKQNDHYDQLTEFIYRYDEFDPLLQRISREEKIIQDDKELFTNYALNRWYNFLSAQAVENIFCSNPKVKANIDRRDKLVDFSINDIVFDHKTSVFPKNFHHNINYALGNKTELIKWLYENQSQQGRKHFGNRLFVVVADRNSGEHWKLKAEISWLKEKISVYLEKFEADNLEHMNFIKERITLSDIIWAIKEK